MIKHISGFDYLRSLAAFSVVWIHASYTNDTLAYLSRFNAYAVPAFILMSIYLLLVKTEEKKIDDGLFAKSLFNKILPQYVFWTLLYLTLRYVKISFIKGNSFEVDFSSLFLGGSSVHLWFLPAILIWQLIMFYYLKLSTNLVLDVVLASCSFFIGNYLMGNNYLDTGFLNCFAVYTGYIFTAKIIFKQKVQLNNYNLIYLISTIIFLGLIFYKKNILFDILFSISFFLFFLTKKMKTRNRITLISINSFGIYLIHFLFIQLIVLVEGILKINNSIFFL